MTKYLFIDGNYFLEELKSFSRDCFDGNEIKLHIGALTSIYDKKFFYDAPPTKGDKESEPDFEKRKEEKSKLFSYLRSLSGFHVFEGWTKRHRRFGISQKGVDVMLAVDMLQHTVRKNMESATLLAGDMDFVPVVDALVQEGMWVNVWGVSSTTSGELVTSADNYTRLTIMDVLGNCHTDFISTYGEFARRNFTHPMELENFALRKVGTASNGCKIELRFDNADRRIHACIHKYQENGLGICFGHTDQRFVDRALIDHGIRDITWEATS